MEGTPERVAEIQAAWARERPDLDVSPQGVIGRLHRLAAHLTAELEVVYRRHGLSEGEFDVLAALRRAGAPYERAPGVIHDLLSTLLYVLRSPHLSEAARPRLRAVIERALRFAD